jgi:hypothetical protein
MLEKQAVNAALRTCPDVQSRIFLPLSVYKYDPPLLTTMSGSKTGPKLATGFRTWIDWSAAAIMLTALTRMIEAKTC